ncbi:hypothetical protein DFH09DRAFT_1401417 [Mycena vulgaris]|nr:hypothetical protein DFH09DRAFT_1401417 [Mycena vulgaris]
MSKKSLQFTPLGPFTTMSCAIFIDRGNSTRAMRSIDAAANLMQNLRISLWMRLPPRRPGRPPIIPIVAENYWHIYDKNLFESGVRVLPPISTAGLTAADVPVLVTLVRDQMLAALIEISTNATPDLSRLPLFQNEERVMEFVKRDYSSRPRLHFNAAAMPEDAVFEGKAMSRESLADSAFESVAGSENGTETEEDEEGMVLVGRPA